MSHCEFLRPRALITQMPFTLGRAQLSLSMGIIQQWMVTVGSTHVNYITSRLPRFPTK